MTHFTKEEREAIRSFLHEQRELLALARRPDAEAWAINAIGDANSLNAIQKASFKETARIHIPMLIDFMDVLIKFADEN